MEQSNELQLNEIKNAVVAQPQNAELCIPLQGKHTTHPNEELFDLEKSLLSFFGFKEGSTLDPKVMLLLGHAGSGKSVFSQQLH